MIRISSGTLDSSMEIPTTTEARSKYSHRPSPPPAGRREPGNHLPQRPHGLLAESFGDPASHESEQPIGRRPRDVATDHWISVRWTITVVTRRPSIASPSIPSPSRAV